MKKILQMRRIFHPKQARNIGITKLSAALRQIFTGGMKDSRTNGQSIQRAAKIQRQRFSRYFNTFLLLEY